MEDNILLQRPRLGRTLERGYSLPLNTIFGGLNYRQDGGTAEALKFAALNGRIKSAPSYHNLDRDFMKLNKVGIRKGIVTAKGQKQVNIIFFSEIALFFLSGQKMLYFFLRKRNFTFFFDQNAFELFL